MNTPHSLTTSEAKYQEHVDKIIVESPENMEMGGKISSIRLCYAPLWKTIVRYFLYLASCFVFYLFSIWIPKLKITMQLSDTNVKDATHIIVYGADKNIEVVPFIREKTSAKSLKVFNYRLFKYYYDEASNIFRPSQFKIEELTYPEIHAKYGLGLEKLQVEDNTVFYGKNLTDIPKKSGFKLLVEEILSPFYIFQVYSIIIWALDDYVAYASVIFLFSLISVGLSLYETIQTRTRLRSMSYYEIPVSVWRLVDGKPTKMSCNSSELAPGDLMEIPEGKAMPCDAILLNGSCIMNEAMLTGESIPVIKNSLPYSEVYYSKDDKQYTLYAGTSCIQARYYSGNAVLGLVTRTGFATIKGELIRTMLFPKPTDFKFYSDSFKFMGILGVMALTGFFIDLPAWIASGDDELAKMIIIKASEIVTVAVPPALPTCLQVGISITLSRLKKRKIYCISPNKVNETGRVNVMCFDKTGTLTEEGLDLMGVRPVVYDKNTDELNFTKLISDMSKLNIAIDQPKRTNELSQLMNLEKGKESKHSLYQKTGLLPSEQMLEIMAACHSLTIVDDKMIGDPLDIKMFEATKWDFEENHNQKYDTLVLSIVRPPSLQSGKENPENTQEAPQSDNKEVGIVRRFEFSSKLQRMSVIVKSQVESSFKMHIKGSPEKIRELCHPESIPKNFHHILEKYTERGYRVLACATKPLTLSYRKIMSCERDEIEKDYTFVGFLIMENRLKPVTTGVIDLLHAADIRTIMVTGDNALTAISVARQCHIVSNHQTVYLGDLSEKKVNGEEVILWKDFEHSENRLTNVLEPDGTMPKKVRSDRTKTFAPKQYSPDSNGSDEISLNKRSSLPNAIMDSLLNPDDSAEFKNLLKGDYTQTMEPETSEIKPPFLEDGHPNNTSEYCIAVTGRAFSKIINEAENGDEMYKFMLQKLLKQCVVFARMHPDEKALMIKHMMTEKKNVVGMCGDGANDVGALKTANVGVSLSEAEASIAAPFTSNIQDISCIPTLLREGRAGLSTSYQAFKYMALYSIIQFATVTILYRDLVELTNWSYYHIDIVIILILSATMATSGAYQHLTRSKPTGRLISVPILLSVIGQGIIQITFQLVIYVMMKNKPWYNKEQASNNFETSDPCFENETLYLFSTFQYVWVAFVFMVGKPFRKPFYTNYTFTTSFILLMGANFFFIYNPLNIKFIHDQVMPTKEPFGEGWINTMVIMAVINCVLTFLWEAVVVALISKAWKNHKDRRETLRETCENMYKISAKEAPAVVVC